MIVFGRPLAREAQRRTHAQSLYRRTMVAVIALLVAVSATVALAPANNHPAFPADHFVLACGTTPGPC